MIFNDTSPNATGRIRCVILLALSVALSLIFQYALAPAVGGRNAIMKVPKLSTYLINTWSSGCSDETIALQHCKGNFGVYRVCATTCLFFLLMALGAKIRPSMNREAWPAKYSMYLILVGASIFISNHPWFDWYMPLARALAAIFIVVQQVILIDVAYLWNDAWVENSNRADLIEPGKGVAWLRAILASCVLFFAASLTGIVLLFKHFAQSDECSSNRYLIWTTLFLIVVTTTIQLSISDTGLLTSAVLSLYATYLAYSGLSKNPNGHCNPALHHEHDPMDIIVGVVLTFVSLAWTGWSFTSDRRLMSGSNNIVDSRSGDARVPLISATNSVSGVVSANTDDDDDAEHSNLPADSILNDEPGLLWKLNAVLVFVSSWVAMILTGWGSTDFSSDIANPDKSHANMWIILISQWVAMGLYMWTLAAPKMFPDRDFS